MHAKFADENQENDPVMANALTELANAVHADAATMQLLIDTNQELTATNKTLVQQVEKVVWEVSEWTQHT